MPTVINRMKQIATLGNLRKKKGVLFDPIIQLPQKDGVEACARPQTIQNNHTSLSAMGAPATRRG
jgi:hypothetical protein